jgi:hypothetical protein
LYVDTNVTEKHTDSIFRGEVVVLGGWRVRGRAGLKTEKSISPKRWYLPMSLCGVTTQMKKINMKIISETLLSGYSVVRKTSVVKYYTRLSRKLKL